MYELSSEKMLAVFMFVDKITQRVSCRERDHLLVKLLQLNSQTDILATSTVFICSPTPLDLNGILHSFRVASLNKASLLPFQSEGTP